MRYVLLAAAALTMLAGCADLTPEQRANLAASIQQQAQMSAAQSQAYANAARANRPVNCITNYAGNSAYTSCQ